MGRKPCCEKVGLKKGAWTAEEDEKLINFMLSHGQCCWRVVPKLAGLLRCGKSCRLRWTNYLRPDLRRGLLSEAEEKLVIDLHSQLGNRWSKIASHLPGRTDNEIKNLWNTHIKKKLRKMGIDPLTHKPITPPSADDIELPHHHNHHHQHHQKKKKQQWRHVDASSEEDEKAEEATSKSSPEKETKKEESKTSPAAEAEADASSSLGDFPEFCTDEVPLLQPHEILIPCGSSTSCSSGSSSSCSSPGSSAKVREVELQCMEFPESMCLWGLDDLTGWDSIDEDELWKLDQNAWQYDLH